MYKRTFPSPVSRLDLPLGTIFGLAFSIVLFALMALAQGLGRVERDGYEIEETVVVFDVPMVEEIEEEEEVMSHEVDEDPLELREETTPTFSLDQLDVALNPGVGAGGILGDFVMPALGHRQVEPDALDAADFVDFADLDTIPRPLHGQQLSFPMRLRRRAAQGTVLLRLRLGPDGVVLEADVDRSDLPEFDVIVLDQVRDWRFTPPTLRGQPVHAEALFPIPISIQ